MALTGFDPELVSASIDKVQASFEDLIKAVREEMQTQFVNEMQDKWACNQAMNFFKDVKISIDTLVLAINYTFASVVDSMNSAAAAWAMETESTWSGKTFSRNDKKLDVTVIKENIAGVRGVDPEATSVAAKLTSIESLADQALVSAKSAVQTCGFIGGTQQEEINASLDAIKNKSSETFSSIIENCKVQIQNTAETYKNLEVKVSEAFAGGK